MGILQPGRLPVDYSYGMSRPVPQIKEWYPHLYAKINSLIFKATNYTLRLSAVSYWTLDLDLSKALQTVSVAFQHLIALFNAKPISDFRTSSFSHGNGNSTQTLLTQQHLPEQKYEHCLECTQKIADIKIREDPLIMKNISLVLKQTRPITETERSLIPVKHLGSDGQTFRTSSATFCKSACNLGDRTTDALRHAGEDKVLHLEYDGRKRRTLISDRHFEMLSRKTSFSLKEEEQATEAELITSWNQTATLSNMDIASSSGSSGILFAGIHVWNVYPNAVKIRLNSACREILSIDISWGSLWADTKLVQLTVNPHLASINSSNYTRQVFKHWMISLTELQTEFQAFLFLYSTSRHEAHGLSAHLSSDDDESK
ncbi:hypothetical protein Anapl_12206 [Anas platyrhynchos]|uniref:Uncharacterized protein n=1 Tax=Anas platyrhynchos TaxID=8839 RepID=R0LSR8_ANAPL|nr:hypothetical protein Anapl_12206 [Anas platyrhynchos]